jgi:lipase chaperone LimK
MQSSPSVYRLALGLLALSFITTFASAEDGMAKEKKPSKTALEKYDTNKDGQLSDEEKAQAKEASRAKAKHTREENLAKYDTNKDGKLDDSEKAVKKADEDAARAARKEAAKTAKETESK